MMLTSRPNVQGALQPYSISIVSYKHGLLVIHICMENITRKTRASYNTYMYTAAALCPRARPGLKLHFKQINIVGCA